MPDTDRSVRSIPFFDFTYAHACSDFDTDSQLERRLREILDDEPFTQAPYEQDPESQHDPNNRFCCIFISDFFTQNKSLVYYIKGTRNTERFYGGMTGMQAFNGAVLFAVTAHDFANVLQPTKFRPKKLAKTSMPIETTKWRYIYDTGYLAWGKSGIDLDKYAKKMESRHDGAGPGGRGGSHSDSGKDNGDTNQDTRKPRGRTQNRTQPMSEKKRGKMKAVDQEVRCRGPKNGVMCSEAGEKCAIIKDDGFSESDTESGSDEDWTEPQIVDESTILEAYQVTKQLDTIDDIWNALKANNLSGDLNMSDSRQDSVVDWLPEEVAYLARREEEFEQKLAVMAPADRDAKSIAELGRLESRIAADRVLLVQKVANEWFQEWKVNCEQSLREDLCELYVPGTDKHEIESGLKDEIILLIRDNTHGFDGTLDKAELENIADLAENMALKGGKLVEIPTCRINDVSPKECVASRDLNNFLANQNKDYISRLADTCFKHDVQVWKLSSTEHEALPIENLSGHQQSRRTPPSQTLGKRLHIGEAEPGLPKKQRTGSPGSQRPSILDEIPEAAQDGLPPRVPGMDPSSQQSEARRPQQEAKATVHGRPPTAPGAYSLEVHYRMVTDEAQTRAEASGQCQNSEGRRSLRRRAQKIDYKALNDGTDPLATARKPDQTKEHKSQLEVEEQTPAGQQQHQQPALSAGVLALNPSRAHTPAPSAKNKDAWQGDAIPGAGQEWEFDVQQARAITQQNIEHETDQLFAKRRQITELPFIPVDIHDPELPELIPDVPPLNPDPFKGPDARSMVEDPSSSDHAARQGSPSPILAEVYMDSVGPFLNAPDPSTWPLRFSPPSAEKEEILEDPWVSPARPQTQTFGVPDTGGPPSRQAVEYGTIRPGQKLVYGGSSNLPPPLLPPRAESSTG